MLDTVFLDGVDDSAIIYIDDICVISDGPFGLHQLETIFKKSQQARMTLHFEN